MKNTLPILSLAVVGALYGLSTASAASILGENLASYAVLGAAGVTNVATSTIGGNLGSYSNASVGGGYVFTSGSLQPASGLQAQLELNAAINAVNLSGPSTVITNGDLDAWQSSHDNVITPGTYTVSGASTNLSGHLFLDGQGSSTAVWNFIFTSTLITSTTSNVTVKNVGNGAGVGLYWSVASAATLNGSTFAGNVLAHDLISSDGNLTIGCGRLLSATTQVTLNKDNISLGCGEYAASGGFDQGVNIGSGGQAVPEPAALLLMLVGAAGLLRRQRILHQH